MQSRNKKGQFVKGIAPWNRNKKTGFAPWLGKNRSKKTKEKISNSKQGKRCSPNTEFKKGHIPWNKDKIGVMPIPWNKKGPVTKTCLYCGKEFSVTKPSRAKKRKYCSSRCARLANNKLISTAVKEKWQEKGYRERQIKAILKGMLKRPTSLEKQMIDIINRNNLSYKYVGDGSFLIGYKNPDFINTNGEKKLIEVGNKYHHQGNYIKKRRRHFAKYGWTSFIFIGDELNEKKIISTLRKE